MHQGYTRLLSIRNCRAPAGAFLCRPAVRQDAMPFPAMPDPAAERRRDHDRRHPERDTLLLAAAGAAQVLGANHSVTKALAKASITMDKVDLWHARLAVKTLRKDQREAIAAAGEG